jgi:hypothetical protein
MILKGNQRAGGSQLAAHLTNLRDNDHVTVHELRGFVSDDLHGAFNEAYAVSRGHEVQAVPVLPQSQSAGDGGCAGRGI